MKYAQARQYKENSPKLTAKERIEHLRNQFFKNTDTSCFKRNLTNRDTLKQKRNHSALQFKKDNDLPLAEVEKDKEYIGCDDTYKKDNRIKKAFDFRVENIDKMNDKILDLLQYVKVKPNPNKQKGKMLPMQEMRAQELKKIRQNLGEKSNKYDKEDSLKQTEIIDRKSCSQQMYQKIMQVDHNYGDIKSFDQYLNRQRQVDPKTKTQETFGKNNYQYMEYTGRKQSKTTIEANDKSTSSLRNMMQERQRYRMDNYQQYEKQASKTLKYQQEKQKQAQHTQKRENLPRRTQQGARNRNYNYYYNKQSITNSEDSLNKQQSNKNLSINQQINRVLAKIEQSQAKRKQMFIKYNENKQKQKNEQKKLVNGLPKHIGLSKATLKSYYVDSDKQSSTQRNQNSNFKLQVYPCQKPLKNK